MRLTVLFGLVLALRAESPDLKRNQKVQRLSAQVLRAQAAYNAEMKTWIADCEAKGLQLTPVAGNLMDCVPKQPQTQGQQPDSDSAKPGPTGVAQ